MTQEDLGLLLDSLLVQWENEVVEFKRGGKGFSTGDIGEYFSALSNEANLACYPRAWLVFGVDNKTRKVVGTDYDVSSESLNKPMAVLFSSMRLATSHCTFRQSFFACFRTEQLLG